MSNVAAAYRILENFRLSARWCKRAAEHGDGDALTDWGYCLQDGIGIRKDTRTAERAYSMRYPLQLGEFDEDMMTG